MNKKESFNKIVKDIKAIKIQGARNIAKQALYAYSLIPTKSSRKKLLKTRPTEPMLQNVLERTKTEKYEDILEHFDDAQDKINKIVFKLIKPKDVVYTHCHSTNVTHSLIYAKKKKKNFEVYNSETRPLFQGRKTAKELSSAGIKVTMFVDSAMGVALSKEQGTKKVSKVFVGADALTKNGVANKIGSETLAKLAKQEKIPFYIIADSWKFTKKKVKMEERNWKEVWGRLLPKIKKPRNVKIENPAFEFIEKKYITGIVTELGLMKYDVFVKKMMK